MALTLRKIKQARKVQALVKRYGKHGTGTEGGHSQEWIYTNKIYPIFDISKVTFYDYLKIDCRFEMKNLNKKALSLENKTSK